MSLCESRSRLENASAYEQSNRPSHRTRSARAVALLQPVSRGGPPAVVLSFAKIPKRKRQSNRNRGATAIRIPQAGNCQIGKSGGLFALWPQRACWWQPQSFAEAGDRASSKVSKA